MKRLISDRRRSGLAALAAVSLVLLSAQTTRADLVFSADTAYVPPGASTANVMEVTLTNTGSSAVDIAGFAFQLTASSSNISFTQVTDATVTPYIFAGNSYWGPDITIYGDPNVPGPAISGGDNVLNANTFTSVAAGATVGLGEVFFDVTPGLSVGSVVAVQFTGGINSADNLSDASANPVNVDLMKDGSVAVVPAPSTFIVSAGILFLAGLRKVARRRGKATA